ncbi:hypothetical protein M446_1535 [Methylobacterium sp. 4-46]|nr:hypothetical protein M446_1535 [Methylobacterium sp. 4-46]
MGGGPLGRCADTDGTSASRVVQRRVRTSHVVGQARFSPAPARADIALPRPNRERVEPAQSENDALQEVGDGREHHPSRSVPRGVGRLC